MTIEIAPPSWPQLSFVLAQHVITTGLHIGFLTRVEARQFETAAETYNRWLAFITTSATSPEGRSSERATASLRVRALLTEQFIPHLYHSDRPCCKNLRIDLDRIIERAQSVQLLEMPSPPEDVKNGPFNAVELEHAPVAGTASANAKAIPLFDEFHTLEKDYLAMTELREKKGIEEEMLDEEKRQQEDDHPFAIFNTDSSMDLKYLIQGITKNRQKITLSDRDIRNLLSEFRPQHKTKWASDDKLGQEQLYEACEKVLMDLKNFTDHSGPFLNRVSRREAPDYYDVIKNPMDLGTVAKKMKAFQYRSKKEFSDDLYLIYTNCLQYNTDPSSEYRKHAIAMRRKTDRLLLKIPDIVVKSKSGIELEIFGDDTSDGEDPHAPRKSTPAMTSEQSHGSDQRERSLTREPIENPMDGDVTFITSDNEDSVSMSPSDSTTYKTYGGKRPKEKRSHDFEDDEENLEMDDLQNQLWRDMTQITRAKLGIELDQQYEAPFSDREAIVRSPFDMERFQLTERLHGNPESVQKLVKCPSEKFEKWVEVRGAHVLLAGNLDLDLCDDEPVDVFAKKASPSPEDKEVDSQRADLFLPEYQFTSGIPEIQIGNEDLFDGLLARRASATIQNNEGYTDSPLDIYPSVRFPTHGLNRIMDQNLHQLQRIRTMYAKCNAIKNNTPASSIPFIDTQVTSASLPSTATISKLDELPLILTPESGFNLLERTISKLLKHAGFEGAQKSALNVLTEMMIDYMFGLGKTLRYYWDDYGNRRMTNEEILVHALYENGTKSIDDLESYIHNDIERYGARLEDIHRKLETSYQDLLSGSCDRSEEDEEGIFQYEEAFVTGTFGEDFGDDFFGFKAIGLDQEYNLDTFSIPARLWSGSNKEKALDVKTSEKEPTLAYPPPPRFTPVSVDTQVIGLLKPFFELKLTEKLVEDEDIPNRHRHRPKYPPTNKALNGRRKLNEPSSPGGGADGRGGGGSGGSGGFNGSGSSGNSSKAKRKRPTEEIQAMKEEREKKKLQKLEEKAQRMAEKEQRRKMREELKEKERLLKQGTKGKKIQAKKVAVTS